ncbi:MAG: trans-aconitate 2-methyltransferase, partial [Pyrinomonadaceae bacterium]
MNQHGTHSLWENPAEWDAERYHRISAPQVAWGERVLDRVVLRGDETVLDAGCGTGRLTAKLIERLPSGCVLAVDKSQNMLRAASEHLSLRFGSRARFVRADLAWLPCERAADGIFSTAAFHWVTDHPRLFRSLFESLKPGGWLIAQCGGAGNLMRFHRRVLGLTASAPYDRYFAGWREPKEYADDAVTAERLRAAGFTDIRTSLEPAPTSFGSAEEYVEFVASVVLRLHLSRLPDGGSRAS